MKNKLKRLRTSNPKDYWNILNSNRHPNDNKNTIDINSLFDYFKQLNSNGDENGECKLEDILPNIDSTNDELNSPITGEEIKRCIIKMNSNKSPGNDCIINEYITSTIDIVLPIYVTLFNIIYDTGIIPTVWLERNRIPIYKKKGDQLDPRNYRPITLLNCLGKLFTSIINSRLTVFSDELELLDKNQSGFRQSYSTIDNIFVLHILLELLKGTKKNMYCAFIDFEKAFDLLDYGKKY